MPYYDLSQLTQFNPALFYDFVPEADPKAEIQENPNQFITLKQYVHQQRGLFDALVYAEKTIVPCFRKGFDTVSPDELITYIQGIHQRAGKTVAAFFDATSGEYSKASIMSWEQGPNFMLFIRGYLSGQLAEHSVRQFSETLGRQFEVADIDALERLITLLMRVRDDESLVFPTLDKDVTALDRGGLIAFERLQVAYYKPDYFTAAEKACIKQFVSLHVPYFEIPSAMQAYAERTLAALRTCDVESDAAIASTLAELFYELIDLHPFPNANKRTTAILLNTILVAMGKPSILLRYPSEADDPNSLHAKAFDAIDTSRQPLADLILDRLHATPYEDTTSYDAARLKSELLEQLEMLEAQCGTEKTGDFLIYMMHQFTLIVDKTQPAKAIEKAFALSALAYIPTLQAALAVDQIESTPENKKAFLKAALNGIVQQNCAWRFYKNNTVVILECADVSERDKLAALLKATDAMKVTSTRRSDTKVPVIKLETFHLYQLYERQNASAPSDTHQASASSQAAAEEPAPSTPSL